jgi:MoxR-like ATPase
VQEYAVDLVCATRDPARYGLAELEPLLTYGASPRASLGLLAAGRALALLRRRTYALPQDVFDVAPDVLGHRLVLSYEALAQGVEVDHVLNRLLATVPAPRITPTQDATARPVPPAPNGAAGPGGAPGAEAGAGAGSGTSATPVETGDGDTAAAPAGAGAVGTATATVDAPDPSDEVAPGATGVPHRPDVLDDEDGSGEQRTHRVVRPAPPEPPA